MFRLFDMLGRSTAIKALDDALRAAGVHPVLVPDAVKLTVIQLLKRTPDQQSQHTAFTDAAQLLAFCILGPGQFRESNSAYDAALAERRLEAAIDDGSSLDAKLILLTLHADLISPEIADRIDLDDP